MDTVFCSKEQMATDFTGGGTTGQGFLLVGVQVVVKPLCLFSLVVIENLFL